MIEALDFHELFASPLTEEAVRAFERGLSDRLTEALAPQPGPQLREQVVQLKASIRRPWEANDLPGFTGLALALHGARALNPSYLRRLAWALLTQHRFEEAAPLFALLPDDDHGRWFDEARALAGAGRLAEAADAAALCRKRLAEAPSEPDLRTALKALERRPSALDRAAGWLAGRSAVRTHLHAGRMDEAGAAFSELLQRRAELLGEAVQAAMEPKAEDWGQLRRQVGACLLLGLEDRAAERLAAVPPAGALAEAAPLFGAAAAASGVPADALLAALSAQAGSKAERGFTGLALQVARGEADWPALLAVKRPAAAVVQAVAALLAQAGRLEPAIALHGELAIGKRRQAPRIELALCQSRETTERLGFRTAPRPGPRRVFDLFPYNGEIERLKIKLHEMAPWVDRFVLVESAMTFAGRPKPLRFEDARGELGPFLDKITYVPVERFPAHATSPWARELYQRDQALEALQGLCDPEDLVILSDVDEVVDRRTVQAFEGEIAPLAMSVFRFFLNYRLAGEQWRTASICRARHLEGWGPSLIRMVLAPRRWNLRIGGAGWHFTSVGGAEEIAEKLASYAHQENNRPDSEAHYATVLERLRSGELDQGWERCGLDELPAYVADNREALARLIL